MSDRFASTLIYFMNDRLLISESHIKEFDRNDLKSFENEIENTYKRIEVVENASYRHHHHRHTSTSTPNGTSSTMNTLRQRLDNLQMEANALRNETNTNVQKY